jgi:hypothetical protein
MSKKAILYINGASDSKSESFHCTMKYPDKVTAKTGSVANFVFQPIMIRIVKKILEAAAR